MGPLPMIRMDLMDKSFGIGNSIYIFFEALVRCKLSANLTDSKLKKSRKSNCFLTKTKSLLIMTLSAYWNS